MICSRSSRVAHDLLGLDLDVDRLPLRAAVRLVEQHARVRQGEALARRARGRSTAAADAAWPMHVVETSGLMYCIVS